MKRILASLLAAFAATAAMADALDTTLFSMKSEMTIPGYAGSTTLANFPVLVRLSAGSPSGFAYADVTNGDIRFADANGNSLPFEIEKWDSSGESHVWVSVPSLSGQATTITMYYGAITGKLPPVDSTGVWSLAGYQDVHHFSDASGYMDIESSANNLTVTRQGANTVDAAGVLGSSLATGSSGYNGLSIAVDNSWAWGAGGTVTFSAWGKCGVDGTSRHLFGTTVAYGEANVSTLTFRANVGGTTVEGAIPSASGWHLYTVVLDGSDLSLFINGTLAESKSGSIAAASAALYWGSNGSNRWKGSIDEARLRNVADTPDCRLDPGVLRHDDQCQLRCCRGGRGERHHSSDLYQWHDGHAARRDQVRLPNPAHHFRLRRLRRDRDPAGAGPPRLHLGPGLRRFCARLRREQLPLRRRFR